MEKVINNIITLRYGGLKHNATISISYKSDNLVTFRICIRDMDIDISKDIKTIEPSFSQSEIDNIIYEMICEREDSVGEYGFTYRK